MRIGLLVLVALVVSGCATHPGRKREVHAQRLSVVGSLGAVAALPVAAVAGGAVAGEGGAVVGLGVGAVGAIVLPSAGQLYAGRFFTPGLGLRVVGLGLLVGSS